MPTSPVHLADPKPGCFLAGNGVIYRRDSRTDHNDFDSDRFTHPRPISLSHPGLTAQSYGESGHTIQTVHHPTVTLFVVSMGLFGWAEAKSIEAGHATVSWKGKGVIDDLEDGDRVIRSTGAGTVLVKHLPEAQHLRRFMPKN